MLIMPRAVAHTAVSTCPVSQTARWLGLLLLALALLWPAATRADATPDGREMSYGQLLETARHPPLRRSWAILAGEVRHRKRGERTLRLPVALRAVFAPERTLAQVIFNEHEWYSISQEFGSGLEGGAVLRDRAAPPERVSLADIGIRPSDFTLGFLYWDFETGLGEDRVKTLHTRKVRLTHPKADEHVVVWISTKYFFPVRVHWYRKGEQDPHRQLEFRGTKEVKNGMVLVKEVRIQNPGWKTEVRFTDFKVELVADEPIPEDLFKEP